MNPKTKALTPFKAVGRTLKTVGSSVGRALKKVLIDPSVKYNKIQKEKDSEYRRQAEAGEYN